jgi:glycosyltransferase involved in cell wall biosynthesis
MHLNSQCEPAEPDTQATTPAISVVMPTYNGERFLRPAIESILNQTFPNFELIIIDDGSTDNTPRILSEFKDTRLTALTNQKNLGIAAATNRGLAAARGEYIALQDHDDISLPHRLQTQLAFLNTHPEIALVGSAAELIDENGIAYDNYHEPENDIELKWEALFRCPISHTSVMMRSRIVSETGGYSPDPSLKVASDYDLLSRIVTRHRVANLSQALVKWRRHPGASMITNEPRLQRGIESVSLRNLGALRNGHSDRDPDWEYICLGSRAFLCTPAGQLPVLKPEQVICGLQFLCGLQKTFCQTYNCSQSAAAPLRQRLNWTWGKHAVALAVRAHWDWRSRVRISALGIRCFLLAAWATILLGVRKQR